MHIHYYSSRVRTVDRAGYFFLLLKALSANKAATFDAKESWFRLCIRKYAGNKCIDHILVPQKLPLCKEPARIRRFSGSWNKCYCGVALQRSRHPLQRSFESHFVRQLSHPQPVEQKVTETHEWSGEKVKCIEDRFSPHSCCFLQLLYNILLILSCLTGNYGVQSPTFLSVPPKCCSVLLLFFPILPSPLIFSSIFISVSLPLFLAVSV